MPVEQVHTSLAVPAEYVPYIIGAGGRTMRGIVKGSGARSVFVDTREGTAETRFGVEWRYVRIAGTPCQANRARMLLLKNCAVAAARAGNGDRDSD